MRPFKRIVSIIITVALTLSLFGLQGQNTVEVDNVMIRHVDMSAQESMEALKARGVFDDAGDGMFPPNEAITRAQFLYLVVGTLSLVDSTASKNYSDVSPDAWYKAYTASALKLGLTEGIWQSTLSPDSEINKQDIAVIMFRAAHVAGIKLSMKEEPITFADQRSISGYAQEAVTALQRSGVFGLFQENKFNPSGAVQTEQASKFLYNLAFQTMDSLNGVHPKLFLTPKRVEELKQLISTSPVYQRAWKDVKTTADKLNHPPVYKNDSGEQLWMRDAGEALSNFAMAYLMTRDRVYLNKAEQWAKTICEYPTWGQSAGKANYTDLPIGHLYLGLAITYDWLYNDLTADTRSLIRQTIVTRGPYYLAELSPDRVGSIKDQILQNHLWVKTAGFAAAAMALYDDARETVKPWIDYSAGRFKATMEALGPDGASHEGVGYWQYGAEYMLKYMFLSRDLLGLDLYKTQWWQNTVNYPLYMSTPRKAWNTISSGNMNVDIGDSPRYNWYGPDYILRALAKEYKNGTAQWLANEIDKRNLDNKTATWLNMIMFDDSVSPVSPESLPTMHYFEDMGIVSGRSDWSGDESQVIFKSGPALGHKATDKYSYSPTAGRYYINSFNPGHTHPDANAFSIFANGEWLVPWPGYVQRKTAYENTLLVDGVGQLGQAATATYWDSTVQLERKLHPSILKAESTQTIDHYVGDATDNYPQLQKYVRHLIYLKQQNVLLVLDDIRSDMPRNLELVFHSEKDGSQVARQKDGSFIIQGDRTQMRVAPLTSDGVIVTGSDQTIINRSNQPAKTRYTIDLKKNTTKWLNATAFSWSTGAAITPNSVELSITGQQWSFTVGSQTVVFNWESGEIVH